MNNDALKPETMAALRGIAAKSDADLTVIPFADNRRYIDWQTEHMTATGLLRFWPYRPDFDPDNCDESFAAALRFEEDLQR